jgi:hypothetical protein
MKATDAVEECNPSLEGVLSAISPVKSGGPQVNTKGEVPGVNTWGINRLQNVNFAISIVDVLIKLAISKPIIQSKLKINACGNY